MPAFELRRPLAWPDTLARALANVLSPPVATVAILLLVSSRVGAVQAWRWAALCSAIGILPPVAYVAWLTRRGLVTDMHLPLREERTRPFVAALLSSAAALVVTNVLGAPALVVVSAATAWLLTTVMFLITLRWKISTHCAAAAALAAMAIGLRGVPALPVVAVVPVVAWSRLRLHRHDRGQVLAGAVVGAVVTTAAWMLFA
jgi:membrane-associated phospholipid phosphatase